MTLTRPILLVDDDPTILDYVERQLVSMVPNEIVIFQDPAKALEWAKHNIAALGLIDFRMPNYSGLDLIKHLRRLNGYQNNPMIMLTSETSRDLIPALFDAGFTDYTHKPIQRNELFARIHNALDLYESKLILQNEKDHLTKMVNQAKSELIEKEMRFRLAIEATEDGIWDYDFETQNLFLSKKWFAILGFSDDDAPQEFTFWSSRIVDADLHIFTSALDALLNGEKTSMNCTYRMVRKDAEIIWVTTKGRLYRDEQNDCVRIVGAQCDVTEMKSAYKQLVHDALHDALTSLPNRALLEERLQHALIRLKRSPENTFSVVFLDVDNFKDINDTFGHAAGDRLLIELGHILRACSREVDTVARLGGDEFVLLLEKTATKADITVVTDRIYQSLQKSFPIVDSHIELRVSMGSVIVDQNYDTVSQIIKNADIALYQSKDRGRNCLTHFDQSMKNLDPRKKALLESLKTALESHEIEIYYQPIVCLRTHDVKGFEALLRWNHPQMGLISPVDFIPLAERNDMINKLSSFVLKGALDQLAVWHRELGHDDLFICVNVVSTQIAEPGFLETLQKDCMLNQIDPSKVILEFSEVSLSQVFKWDSLFLNELKQAGFHIALDDYGESRASIRSLVDYKMSTLKVDRSLSLEILHDERKRRLFDLMIHLGHETGLKVVVEGIQTQDILNYVERSQAEYGQGFLFSKPAPVKEATKYLLKHAPSANSRAG